MKRRRSHTFRISSYPAERIVAKTALAQQSSRWKIFASEHADSNLANWLGRKLGQNTKDVRLGTVKTKKTNSGPAENSNSGNRRRQPSQARSAETRARILQCAREAFGAFGFAAANVREIAKAAETTHSMITYHFGSKEELWRESVRDMFALLQERVIDPTESEQGLSLEARFRKLIRLYTRYCADHPEHARITFSETIAGGERLEWMVKKFVKSNHGTTTLYLKGLMENGILPEMPLTSLFYALVGMIQLPFVLEKEAKSALDYDFMREEAIERHADTVLALLMPGTRSETAS